MGDIVRKVKLCGLVRRGKKLELVRDWDECPEINALIDTGASASVITRTLAELAGAEVMPGLKKLHGRLRDGAFMAVRLTGCGPSPHVVVVDDQLAAEAAPDAFMILGHDYLQDNRARIDYANGDLVTCPPREDAPTKRGGRKATSGNGRSKPRNQR